MLCVIETHPVQYHAPVYRCVQQRFGVPVSAIYGSDYSVSGARDTEFGASVKWDVDLLGSYSHCFLRTVEDGGGRSSDQVSARGLRAALRRMRPRVILLLGYSPAFYGWACLEAGRTGCALMFRGETTDHARRRGTLKAAARGLALRGLYGRCGRLLYVGRRSREHFRRLHCPEAKLIFSPYCVDTEPFQADEEGRVRWRETTRREWGLTEDQRVVVFSGKLSRRKGVDLLVEAAKTLPPEMRARVVLLFLGAGELEAELRTRAAADPPVACRFVGFQNQTWLSRFYHAGDVLALPSVSSETWGLVVNEALHHGLPCVASDEVGCAPDLIVAGETGEVCRAGEIGSLAEGLRCVLTWSAADPAATRARCREQVAGYTTERAAEGIARAYRELAGVPAAVPARL